MTLGIDKMSDEELRALDAWSRECVLCSLALERKRLADQKSDARRQLRDALLNKLDNPGKDAEAVILIARDAIDRLSYHIDARKDQIRILQTLQRSTPV
jgi:hypothetical protein